MSKPTSSTIMAVELCISDKNKPLLLANSAFVPYVVDALLLVRGEVKHVSVLARVSATRRFGPCPLLTTVVLHVFEQDPQHPRAGMQEDLKAWCQQHHCEALAQLAVHEGSREAMLRDGSVVPALETVATRGLTEAARELATAALSALSDKKLTMAVEGQKHVMLSYQWDAQATIQRTNQSLIARGYVTWFDLTNMKGSTMDNE